ncbi:MAG: PAS domain-containing protein [Cryomorphaceae bacterium]|nr:PAS domain-containing protein [Cryomorphaceae bacterium]
MKTQKTYWTPGVYNIYDVPKDFDHNLLEGIAHYVGGDQQLIENSLNAAINERKPFSVNARLKSAADKIKHVEVTGTYVEDKNGKRVIGSIRDISDAYKLKSALGVSENLFAFSSDIGKVATILIEGNSFKANTYFSKLFGIPLYGKKRVSSLKIEMTSEKNNAAVDINVLITSASSADESRSQGHFLVKTKTLGSIWMDMLGTQRREIYKTQSSPFAISTI